MPGASEPRYGLRRSSETMVVVVAYFWCFGLSLKGQRFLWAGIDPISPPSETHGKVLPHGMYILLAAGPCVLGGGAGYCPRVCSTYFKSHPNTAINIHNLKNLSRYAKMLKTWPHLRLNQHTSQQATNLRLLKPW